MPKSRIPMFATCNDTDRFAVCVDGRFGLFSSREDAERVYALIGGRDEEGELEETPFGSAALLPPGGGGNRTRAVLSAFAPVDIEAYIRLSWDDYHNPPESALPLPAGSPADPWGDILAGLFLGIDSPRSCAPWNAEEVAALERRQDDPAKPPYTCGRCPAHLVPKSEGWYCPSCCRLVQNWAYRVDIDRHIPSPSPSSRPDGELVLRRASENERLAGWHFAFEVLQQIRRETYPAAGECPRLEEIDAVLAVLAKHHLLNKTRVIDAKVN